MNYEYDKVYVNGVAFPYTPVHDAAQNDVDLDKKGKTNKKLKMNTQASKYLTARGKELKEAAAAYAKEHPAGSGRRKQAKMKKIEEMVASAS